jgi:hypothetical protein
MKLLRFFPLLAFYLLGCNMYSSSKADTKAALITTKVDTTKSFKIDDYWATPKSSFKFNSLNKSGLDTLDLVVCADFVYSPFGKIKNKSEFGSSLLRNFGLQNKIQTITFGQAEVQILRHNASKLIFFFDDTDTSIHSDILKGEIYVVDVEFVNNIRIGIETNDFYNTFFDYFPAELVDKYKVVVLESCVDGIKHIYTFKDGKLNSVKFISDYKFDVDY